MIPIDFNECKKVELEILRYIDIKCAKFDLKYFLAFGTLLGAVRHGGFIPWDDDIDIVMPRTDYEKLYEILKDDPIYKMVNYKNDDTILIGFSKVFDTRTVIQYNKPFAFKQKYGLFVDVFPLDKLPKNKIFKLQQKAKLRILHHLLFYKSYKFKNKNIKDILFLKVVKNMSLNKLIYNIDTICKDSNNSQSNMMFTGVFPIYRNRKYNIDIFENSIKMRFEKYEFNVPKMYDMYLKILYGDYMKLPPIEKRIPSHDFTAYYIKEKSL